MAHLLRERDLEREIELDSAGTGAWHVGNPPDERATRAASARGIELTGAARQVEAADYERFDLLVAMDRHNREDLLSSAPDERARAKVRLLREFDPEALAAGELDVPDPYYGGERGFEGVVEIVVRGCEGLLATLPARPQA